MKVRLAFAGLLLVATVIVGCAPQNSPQGAAEQVLKAIDRLDFDEAKKFAVDDGLAAVSAIETLFAAMSEGHKAVAANQNYSFGAVSEKDGETSVSFKLGEKEFAISTKKVGDDWKVSKLGYDQIGALIPNNPQAVTEAFIGAFNAYNVDMAMPFASDETKKILTAIASILLQTNKNDLASAAKQPHPTVLKASENGDAAEVTFKVGDGKEQTVNLIKSAGFWKVDMKKDS